MAEEIVFETTVSYLLAKVGTLIRNSLERQMIPLGLHSGQISVLIELWKRDGQKQIDIAKRLSVSAPTVSKMLDGLAEVNLIERRQLDDDARSSRVFLTMNGRAMKETVTPVWREFEVNYLSALTESERWVMADLLGKIRTSITGVDDDE